MEITLPERFAFSTDLAVRVGDVNFAAHLGHDSLVTLLHEARAQLFRRLGGHELDIFGVGIILADLAVVYRAEAFAGDVLRVDIAARDFTTRGCELVYRVVRHSGPVARSRSVDRSAPHGEPGGSGELGAGGPRGRAGALGSESSPVEIARARTGMVFFDYAARLPVAVPPAFRTFFEPEQPAGPVEALKSD